MEFLQDMMRRPCQLMREDWTKYGKGKMPRTVWGYRRKYTELITEMRRQVATQPALRAISQLGHDSPTGPNKKVLAAIMRL
jgi:hypothetical protein